jgi:hypothetical protein
VFPDLIEQRRSFLPAQPMARGVIHLRLARFAVDGE